MTRLATDNGHRTSLDVLIEFFGLDQAELEDEIALGLHHFPHGAALGMNSIDRSWRS